MPNLADAVRSLVNDRGISEDLVLRTVERALLAAYKKKFKTDVNAVTRIDEEKADVRLFSRREIAEKVVDPVFEISLDDAKEIAENAELGDEVLVEINPESEFGRIAAQTAKHVVLQSLSEIERDSTFQEYKTKEGELINGYFQRERDGTIYVDLGRAEGRLYKSEQSPKEVFSKKDRIRAYVKSVERTPHGPKIILSRACPEFIKKLFELEVAEIYDKIVEIKKIVREPGFRTKVCVASRRDDVDPVGACVGMRGMRIQAIVREVEGEKIDIVKYSDAVATFVGNALVPSKVNRVIIKTEEEKSCIAIVSDSGLAQAIGRGGQNVRLASKLVGWKIDVKTESQYEEYRKTHRTDIGGIFGDVGGTAITQLPGLTPGVAAKLQGAGITTVEDLVEYSKEDLMKIDGVGEQTATKILEIIRDNVEVEEEEAEQAAAPVEQREEVAEVQEFECPNCKAKVTTAMESCPSCGVQFEFEEEEVDGGGKPGESE